MFTTGQTNLGWFSIMSFIIAVPTGIKVFNWLATMWRGSISLTTAMLMVVSQGRPRARARTAGSHAESGIVESR